MWQENLSFFFPSSEIVISIIFKVLDVVLLTALPAQTYGLISLKVQDVKDKIFFLWLSSNLPAFAGKTGQAQLVPSVMERFHYTNLLGRWQREEEQSQGMNQVMGELATISCLQEVTWEGAELVRFYF